MEQLQNALTSGYLYGALILMIIIGVVAVIIGWRVKKLQVGQKPSKFIAGVIGLIGFLNNYTKSNVGRFWKSIAPHMLTMSIVLFVFNISGLFAFDTPTRYTAITITFAIWTTILVQITGLRSRKIKHVTSLLGPVKLMSPLMLPLNILGDLTPLISMTLRIFGNIAAGVLLTNLIYYALGWGAIGAGPFLGLIFDIGFGLIQVVVYTVLSLIFISHKLDEKDLQEID
jgi:F-type H+-transporting ATPase subunit a